MDEPKTRWFFVDDEGNYRGPADLECVSILVEGGVIHSETMMHVEGSEDWEPAKTFFEFPVAATSQTPPPLTSVPPPLPSTPPPLPPPSKPEIQNVIDITPRRGWSERISRSLAEHIGDAGEKEMLRILMRRLPLGGDRGYRIVRNLMFETPTGTTQLDLTVVSAFGIFIVEVKTTKDGFSAARSNRVGRSLLREAASSNSRIRSGRTSSTSPFFPKRRGSLRT